MADAERIEDADGLPGDLVHEVAERLREANADLQDYGYHLALVPENGEGVPLEGASDGVRAAAERDGHWSEVEIQKLPNDDLSIRLRGYTEADGSDGQERMAELVRALLRETLF